MFNYHSVTIDDAKWAKPILINANKNSCEYSFVNIYMWSKVYKTLICNYNNTIIARSVSPKFPDTSPYSYLFPVGSEDKEIVIKKIMEESSNDNREFLIFSISKDEKKWMEETFVDTFEFLYSRDECDYIYQSELLSTLKGKKLQKKRNHLSQFLRECPNYKVEPITKDNLQEVIAFNNKWASFSENAEDKGIEKEHNAVDLILENFLNLDLSGCLIRNNNDIIAFSYGSPLNKDMFCVHVEKAVYNINGAYNIINKEFVNMFCKNYKYVNREDDVGSEGLRKAKLSYKPEFLEEKYIAILKNSNVNIYI